MVQIHYRLPNKNKGLEDIPQASNPFFYDFSNGFLTEFGKTVNRRCPDPCLIWQIGVRRISASPTSLVGTIFENWGTYKLKGSITRWPPGHPLNKKARGYSWPGRAGCYTFAFIDYCGYAPGTIGERLRARKDFFAEGISDQTPVDKNSGEGYDQSRNTKGTWSVGCYLNRKL